LLNTLAHARRVFERDVVTLIGGTHLLDADHGTLQRVVEALRSTYNSPRLYLNHCTGQRAYVTLATTFGGRVAPCPAGTILNF
jgi:metal-dependent hydrolase (beta-lactamase superfamily II)